MLTHSLMPLSYLQKSMLAQEALVGRPLYNMRTCFKITGPVDAGALEQALGCVASRHAVLCSRYSSAGAEPCPGLCKPVLMTQSSPAGEEVDLIRDVLWRRHIDLANQLPVRAMLVSSSPAEHYLGLCIHHVAGDSWSLRLFLEELGQGYGRLSRGEPLAAGSAAPSYFEYAQQERMATEDVGWWRDQLSGVGCQPYPKVVEPGDAACSDVISVELNVDARATRAVRELARAARVSPTVVLFAAVSSVTAANRRETEATVGLLAALRDTSRLQLTMGPLLNTLPIRTSWPPRCSGAELIGAHEDAINSALMHKYVPYSRILKACVTERHAGAAPIFLHLVNVDNEFLRLRLRGAKCTWVRSPPEFAIFPALWEFSWGAVGNIRGVLRVSAGAFAPDQAAVLADMFLAGLLRVAARSGIDTGVPVRDDGGLA